MERAAVLIGVRKSHNLPELQAVWSSVDHMRAWALAQGIPNDRIVVLKDEQDPVGIADVKKAVREIVDLGVVEQIVVYFSGHGINNARDEYWLLSDAIVDPDEAVNVSGSEEIARFGNIPHIVFVSDACRTAASGIQAQGVTGGVIFPNLPAHGTEQDVDLFYATALGHPALEIPDVDTSSGTYSAAFTDTLLEALQGQHPEVIDGDLVLIRPLKEFLKREVPIRVYQAVKRKQQPDARVTSDRRWLSQLPKTTGATGAVAPPAPVPAAAPAPPPSRAVPAATAAMAGPPGGDISSIQRLADDALENATQDSPTSFDDMLATTGAAPDESVTTFARMRREAATPYGRTHFETMCGFKISGGRFAGAVLSNGRSEVIDDGEHVRIFPAAQAESVLLVLENGRGVVIPAVAEFVTGLTFVDDDLVNVDYEPSDTSNRFPAFAQKAERLRHLRAVIAASSSMGTFRLGGDADAARLARRMQVEKGLDPSLSLYAAYAYRDLRMRDRIQEMARYQRSDLGFTFFDLALLGRDLQGATIGRTSELLPFAPLLSQGWPLLAASQIRMPASLERVRSHLVPTSLWSLYRPEGVAMIRKALAAGDV